MFGQLYAHDELNKYIAIFGSLFDNIIISRDIGDKPNQKFKVPIEYGPREKFLARTDNDPKLNKPAAELLPRMAFEMTGMEYDASRKRPSNQRWATPKTNGNNKISFDSMFMPVPYNFHFKLRIQANRAMDGFRVITNILPNFRPDITVSASIVDELPDYVLDIPIIYNDISYEDTYEGSFNEIRTIMWELDFTMKAEIYGPVSEAKIIKIAKVNLYADVNGEFSTIPDETIQVQPGLTANGQPTSNAALSIPVFQIDEGSDWGYVTIITNPSGRS